MATGYVLPDTHIDATTTTWEPVVSPNCTTRGYLIHVQGNGLSFKISNSSDGANPTTIPSDNGGRGRGGIIPANTIVEYVQSVGTDHTLAVAWTKD